MKGFYNTSTPRYDDRIRGINTKRTKTCAYTHVYARARAHTHTHTHTHTHAHMHARTHTCKRAHAHARTHTHTIPLYFNSKLRGLCAKRHKENVISVLPTIGFINLPGGAKDDTETMVGKGAVILTETRIILYGSYADRFGSATDHIGGCGLYGVCLLQCCPCFLRLLVEVPLCTYYLTRVHHVCMRA